MWSVLRRDCFGFDLKLNMHHRLRVFYNIVRELLTHPELEKYNFLFYNIFFYFDVWWLPQDVWELCYFISNSPPLLSVSLHLLSPSLGKFQLKCLTNLPCQSCWSCCTQRISINLHESWPLLDWFMSWWVLQSKHNTVRLSEFKLGLLDIDCQSMWTFKLLGILKLKILSTKVRENYRIFCADFILMIGVCEI